MNFPLEAISAMADLIVVGQIENVSSNSYQFKISNTVKGIAKETIKVQMFKNWICDTRINEATKGQRLFLFLRKVRGEYIILNGSTGERFISEETVILSRFTENPSVDELSNAIKNFTACFKLKKKIYLPFEKNFLIQLKTDSEITAFAKKSELTTWFFEQTKKYIIQKQD